MNETKTILVIEPKGTTPLTLTSEIRESVKSLFFNLGFKYLLNRLALQREYMRKTLEESQGLTEKELIRLQNGIYWTNWLERQAQSLSQYEPPQQPARQLRKSEFEMLEEIRKNISDPTRPEFNLNSEGMNLATTP